MAKQSAQQQKQPSPSDDQSKSAFASERFCAGNIRQFIKFRNCAIDLSSHGFEVDTDEEQGNDKHYDKFAFPWVRSLNLFVVQ